MNKDPWDGNPNDPVNKIDNSNECGYCGESCEDDYCNRACWIAEIND